MECQEQSHPSKQRMGSEYSLILNCLLGPVFVKSMKLSSMILVITLASNSVSWRGISNKKSNVFFSTIKCFEK